MILNLLYHDISNGRGGNHKVQYMAEHHLGKVGQIK